MGRKDYSLGDLEFRAIFSYLSRILPLLFQTLFHIRRQLCTRGDQQQQCHLCGAEKYSQGTSS